MENDNTTQKNSIPSRYAIDENNLPYVKNRVYGWGKEFNVFITKKGKYFHRSKCSKIKGKNKILLHRYTAVKSYEPCPYCKPKSNIDKWYSATAQKIEPVNAECIQQTAPSEPVIKWYNKTWVIILFLIFFFPVGLVLMWDRNCKWQTFVKIIISALIGIIFIYSLDLNKKQTFDFQTTPVATVTVTQSPIPTPVPTIQPTLEPTPEPVAEIPVSAPSENISESSEFISEETKTTVYITEHGKKYHRVGCQYLSDSKITISLDNAEAKGYTPCSRCW